jgi:hypothetical protein
LDSEASVSGTIFENIYAKQLITINNYVEIKLLFENSIFNNIKVIKNIFGFVSYSSLIVQLEKLMIRNIFESDSEDEISNLIQSITAYWNFQDKFILQFKDTLIKNSNLDILINSKNLYFFFSNVTVIDFKGQGISSYIFLEYVKKKIKPFFQSRNLSMFECRKSNLLISQVSILKISNKFHYKADKMNVLINNNYFFISNFIFIGVPILNSKGNLH